MGILMGMFCTVLKRTGSIFATHIILINSISTTPLLRTACLKFYSIIVAPTMPRQTHTRSTPPPQPATDLTALAQSLCNGRRERNQPTVERGAKLYIVKRRFVQVLIEECSVLAKKRVPGKTN